MKNGTQPGILITDLMSGDGPHLDLAEHFLLRRCDRCGGQTGGAHDVEAHLSATCFQPQVVSLVSA